MKGILSVAAVAFLLALVWLTMPQPIPKKHVPGPAFYTKPRRFLVTGAGSGVGAHIAILLVEKGHIVMATDVAEERFKELREQVPEGKRRNLHTETLDVSKAEQWDALLDSVYSHPDFGGLDVLLNNAGVLKPGNFSDDKVEELIDFHLDVNTKGVMIGGIKTARRMRQQVKEGKLPKGGHIVTISSASAIIPTPGLSLYSVSKFAARAFSIIASWDHESRNLGVYFSVICPEAIRTPMAKVMCPEAIKTPMTVGETEKARHGDGTLVVKKSELFAMSGHRLFTVDDVALVFFNKVLPWRPREVTMFFDNFRGIGAWLVNVFHDSRLVAHARRHMLEGGARFVRRLSKDSGVDLEVLDS
uniref:NAD(P)-binding protein n=1 Tax=Chromera velia CCMP2878 TaxID=1169474 RepID=A0A0G4I8Q5_9ALVE|eukprot:Cvel_12029.t2-p1 / transcript=Cvel_12029.t2 / gene=Cvel_12029 / organism=Chromera_velia_CCMP2878 / gene_product=Diacetyl reductase [(S)-acetoin forming], putative / transcript_product=Diacetyl reductase [(S)-acetoin forming], putative / location=Cvel_scaffold772:31548-35834(-) / protein_length=358 / sequence_SO=supercontig / SO=protein_coding / is_pseudo=false